MVKEKDPTPQKRPVSLFLKSASQLAGVSRPGGSGMELGWQ